MQKIYYLCIMNDCFCPLTTHHALPDVMNNPFGYVPTPLTQEVMAEVCGIIDSMAEWQQEIAKGKMFGILVVRDVNGRVGYLKAYSGQIQGREDWQGWVPAVFDYLQPDGHFVTNENAITEINQRIDMLEHSPRLAIAAARLAKAEHDATERIEAYRIYVKEQKAQRDERRRNGEAESTLIAESQFQKAELKRLRKDMDVSLQPLRDELDAMHREIAMLKADRKRRSDELQSWLFSQFVMLNAKGDKRTLTDIFAPTPQRVPPSGAGECCAPKLLQYAFREGYAPIAIAEFWWGESPKGEVRRHLECYPACQGKCRPILDYMLQGLAVAPNPFEATPDGDSHAEMSEETLPVIYRDEWVVVVDKPAGMLSVPGKVAGHSAIAIVQRMVGRETAVYPVHRLDMQTSGLLVFALTKECYVALQQQFADRRTNKEYIAVVERNAGMKLAVGSTGTISLPLSPDYMNRPCQRVDHAGGKEALTEYEVLAVQPTTVRMRLRPHHGRTHQLRVHCAHAEGLSMPIVGDSLYGHSAERMLLHAERLQLYNPLSGTHYSLHSPCPF